MASHLISAGSDARLLLFPEVLRPQSRGSLPTTLQVDLWPPEPGPVHGARGRKFCWCSRPNFWCFSAPPITPDTPVTFDELQLSSMMPVFHLRKYSQEETALGEAPWESAEGLVLYALCLKKKKKERGRWESLASQDLGEPLLYHNYFCPITELGSFCLQRLDYESAL